MSVVHSTFRIILVFALCVVEQYEAPWQLHVRREVRDHLMLTDGSGIMLSWCRFVHSALWYTWFFKLPKNHIKAADTRVGSCDKAMRHGLTCGEDYNFLADLQEIDVC